jgi:hypothetical protein
MVEKSTKPEFCQNLYISEQRLLHAYLEDHLFVFLQRSNVRNTTVHVRPTVMKAQSIEQRFPDFFARGPLLASKSNYGWILTSLLTQI